MVRVMDQLDIHDDPTTRRAGTRRLRTDPSRPERAAAAAAR